MSNFCDSCGEQLGIPNPRFCPNCGKSMISESSGTQVLVAPESKTSTYDLGIKLEATVDSILQSKGFKTECRKRVLGKTGSRHEIDVIAKKGNLVLAVECKNWTNPVGMEQIRDFWAKLQDIGTEWNGIFVSLMGFTQNAEDFAERCNIDRWDQDFLKEELFAVSVGRAQYANFGETKTVKNALPLNFDFFQVTEVGLKNREKVSASGLLSYHPYFVVDYSYSSKVRDPTKSVHRFSDSGKVFVDALDGSILNSPPVKGAGMVTRAFKLMVSKDAREENRRNQKLIQEMDRGSPVREYDVKGGENYMVRILESVISPQSIKKIASEHIIEKNTETISYKTKKQEEDFLSPPKSYVHVPKRQNIRIKCISLVNVPRWDLSFETGNRTYSKEVLACSGTVLEDTLSYCPKHTGPLRKENVAVCEICGQALCGKHVFQCPTCGKWLCGEHGTFCENCGQIFCDEHIESKCEVCGEFVCSSCLTTCRLCNREYSKKHSMSCSQCGKEACSECVTVTGLIRKKRTCTMCQ